jgi:hypothetical protein
MFSFSPICECLVESGTLCTICEEIAAEMRTDLVQLGAKPNTAINLLQFWMRHYPELVTLKNGDEIHISREQLRMRLQSDNPSIQLTSIERGLKHAGLKVIQSTHGQVSVKIWKVNRDRTKDVKPLVDNKVTRQFKKKKLVK